MAIATAPTTVEAPKGLTPAEKRHLSALERRIEQGLQTFREVGMALMEVRDSRLYREAHDTFEDYCRERWQMDRSRAYQLIGAAEVVKSLGEPADLQNEAQARELVQVLRDDPKQVKVIWERVKASNEPITAPLIRRMRAEVMEPEAPPEPSATDLLVGSVTRLTAQFKRWQASKPSRKERGIVTAAFAALNEAIG